MNTALLHKDVQDFINQNLSSDLTKLILKGSPFHNVSIQEIAIQIAAKKKSQKKLPSWFQTTNIYYPPKLNLEQTSSELTANYKAKLMQGTSIIDITGGFGVDAFAFSKNFQKVVHCEINKELSQIASHNFKQLNASNITTLCNDGVQYLNHSKDPFDGIYIDPSRRQEHKGRVFLLEDCQPNVPSILEILFSRSKTILIKTSPMLDISSAVRALHSVKEIHVIAVMGEVKELLFLLKKYHLRPILIHTVNILKNTTQYFSFRDNEQADSQYDTPKKYLYEPNVAILKAGGFHHISKQLRVCKLHPQSHLYTSNQLLDFPGRSFQITHLLNYDKKKIKRLLPHQKANITTRNFPKTVQQIRKELQIKDGGDHYLFFTTTIKHQRLCIICKKIQKNH